MFKLKPLIFVFALLVSLMFVAHSTEAQTVDKAKCAKAFAPMVQSEGGIYKIEFPMEIAPPPDSRLQELLKIGLIELVRVAEPTSKYSKHGNRFYDLTEEGKKFYVKGKGLKIADISLLDIVEINPVNFGHGSIIYTWKVDKIYPWINEISKDTTMSRRLRYLVDGADGKKTHVVVVKNYSPLELSESSRVTPKSAF